jgi:hypothetical protein
MGRMPTWVSRFCIQAGLAAETSTSCTIRAM